MSETTFKPIGLVRSSIADPKGAPIQPSGAKEIAGRLVLEPEYVEGLKDLEGFSHLVLIYLFHLSKGFDLTVIPFLDKTPRGLFATRAPRRPNPIGLSVVRLERIEGNVLHLMEVDLVDKTPVLDIKPYVPAFDSRPRAETGWLSGKDREAREMRSDSRFREECD